MTRLTRPACTETSYPDTLAIAIILPHALEKRSNVGGRMSLF